MPRKPGKKSPGKALAKPRKSNQAEIEIRRKEVIKLRMRGLGLRTIAKELGVGHMTIKRDLAAIAEETRQKMEQLDRDHLLADCVSVYEEIEKNAWDQYHRCANGTQMKAQFLNVVRSARNDQVKLLTDIGMIAKAPQEVKHTITRDVIQHWSPAAQDLVAMAIIKAGLTPASAPIPDERQLPPAIQDATVLEVEPEEEKVRASA